MSNDSDDTTQILRLDLPVMPTVLIIDDDALVLERLKDLVTSAGYVVHTALSGTEAMSSLERSPASIVISDLNMPGMNGLEVCRRIRAGQWPGYIYVILLTVLDEERDLLAGLDAGADDYLSKRTSSDHFTARLRIATRVVALEYSLTNALEKTRQVAMTDALTGAYNRRYFMRHFSRELKRSRRCGSEVSLLLVDVDRFKKINDSYGHATGDIVLKKLTARIVQSLRRETDWFARIGGEEFAVVLEGTELTGAVACAEALRTAIAESPMNTPSGPVTITVSIGVGGTEELRAGVLPTVTSIMALADGNLFTSKRLGRNRVTISNAMTLFAERESQCK
jgi:two-component system, cell cycle response regulator